MRRSSARSSASTAKPTMPIAIMPLITIDVLMFALSLDQQVADAARRDDQLGADSDCQPSPALMRSPATIDGTDAGSSTSVIIRQLRRAERMRRLDEARLDEFARRGTR